jgi:hypothetical protein
MWSKKKRNEYMTEYRKNLEYQNYQKEYQKKYRIEHITEKAEYSNEWRKNHKSYVYEIWKKWTINNPEKFHPNTLNTLNNSITSSKIKRKPCEICGKLKTDGHHSDYSKPLEVKWLCHKHHIALHKNLIVLN